jgi:hypothetical protein
LASHSRDEASFSAAGCSAERHSHATRLPT